MPEPGKPGFPLGSSAPPVPTPRGAPTAGGKWDSRLWGPIPGLVGPLSWQGRVFWSHPAVLFALPVAAGGSCPLWLHTRTTLPDTNSAARGQSRESSLGLCKGAGWHSGRTACSGAPGQSRAFSNTQSNQWVSTFLPLCSWVTYTHATHTPTCIGPCCFSRKKRTIHALCFLALFW